MTVRSTMPARGSPPADVLLTGGRVMTMDAQRRPAEAVAVRDGRIVAVGRSVDLRSLAPLDREAVAATVRKTNKVILLHEDTRRSGSPPATVLDFLQSTYEAGAKLAKWDRAALERPLEPAAGAA